MMEKMCNHVLCENVFEGNKVTKKCPACKGNIGKQRRLDLNRQYAFNNSLGKPKTKLINSMLSIKFCGIWFSEHEMDFHHFDDRTKSYSVTKYVTNPNADIRNDLKEIKKTIILPSSIHSLITRYQRSKRSKQQSAYTINYIMDKIKISSLGQTPSYDSKKCKFAVAACLTMIDLADK